MTKNDINHNLIESYIMALAAIPEGARNNALYKIGCKLRRKFGLEGDKLRRYLRLANMTLCRPPLDEDEVDRIAASVDRSNTPLGQQTNEGAVDTNSSLRSVDEILSQEISLFPSVTATTPIGTLTIGQFLDDIRDGKYQELCEAVQAEPDKERRNILKQRLPCVTIQSVPCERRKREFCKSNALVCLDIDDVGNDLDGARRTIAELPYAFAVGVSASGRGLFVLVALAEPVDDLKPILKAIQRDIPYTIDKACSDISRLRLVSFDPDLIVKDTVVPFRVKRRSVPHKIGIAVLDSIVERVREIQFTPSGNQYKARDFYITCIDNLCKTATELGLDIGIKNGTPSVFTGEFWRWIEPLAFRHFLQAVGMKQGIPHKIIKDHKFLKNLTEQFASEARFPALSATDTPKINLRNGTLHITPSGVELKPFNKQDGLTYQLPYEYNPSAVAKRFREFLDRVLPDRAVQKLFFQYIAYVFLRQMNLGKILFLYGTGANGKSVLLDVIRMLVGLAQCCAYSLEDLAKTPSTRAELGRHLLNICTEISRSMKTDIFKILAAREPLPVNPKYKDPYIMHEYATSIFAMNEPPKTVEPTDAFFRRFLIIPFNVRIPDEEQDPDLAKKIIDSEMSGVLNYVVKGVQSLLKKGDFDIPESVRNVVDEFRKDSDTVGTFLGENGYCPSDDDSVTLQSMYDLYKIQHPDGVAYREFSKQLRGHGYRVEPKGRHNIRVVYTVRAEVDDVSVVCEVNDKRKIDDEYSMFGTSDAQ